LAYSQRLPIDRLNSEDRPTMSCPLCIKGQCTGLCEDEKKKKKDKKKKKSKKKDKKNK
jgi:hypothetical protein